MSKQSSKSSLTPTHDALVGTRWLPCVIEHENPMTIVVRVLCRDRGKMVDDGSGFTIKRKRQFVRERRPPE